MIPTSPVELDDPESIVSIRVFVTSSCLAVEPCTVYVCVVTESLDRTYMSKSAQARLAMLGALPKERPFVGRVFYRCEGHMLGATYHRTLMALFLVCTGRQSSRHT